MLTGLSHDIKNAVAASDVIVNSSLCEPQSQLIRQTFAMKKIFVANNVGGDVKYYISVEKNDLQLSLNIQQAICQTRNKQ